jgi:hypothetical protein
MSILLIDGVKYEEWRPASEGEFEQVVKEHAKDIFGEQSIYLDIKQKLRSKSGIGSIPDGYVIILGDEPHWHIIEVELASHPVFEHIVPQLVKFIGGIKNLSTQREIISVLHEEISKDKVLTEKIKSRIGSAEIHKFLSTLISQLPRLTILIDRETEELDEAVEELKLETEVVEFQTLIREGGDISQHAHLFKPMVEELKLETKVREGGDSSQYAHLLGPLVEKPLLEELRQRFIERRPEIKPSKVYKDYCFIPIEGHEKIHTEWLLWGRQKLGVELHLERASGEENGRLLDEIMPMKSEVEERMGEHLTFRFPWHGHCARIYIVKPLELSEIREWAIEAMIKFYDIFKPILDKIDA